ncbi:MAG TPA: hypothetical protein VG325_20410 [Solirubrobacteraceae bacterium]|nr:hypothetical protein [Solirubrobacteraceae bacterium]
MVFAGAVIALPNVASAKSTAGCGSHSVPALSVATARSPRVSGAVLVAASGRRITVSASRGSHASVSGTAAAWIEFCLHPRAVTQSVTLVKVAPGGVSVNLSRAGNLTVSHVATGGGSVTTTVAAARHAVLVQVLLDRRQARASVFVNGGRKATVPAAIPLAVGVYVGRSASTVSASASDTPAVSAATPTPTAYAASMPTSAAQPTAGTTSGAKPALATPPPATTATTTAPTTTATAPMATTTAPTAPATTTAPAGTTTASTALTAAQASVVPFNAFAPTSFWNAPLPSTAPVDPNSPAYVSDLVSQVQQYGAWMNTTWYSVPVYVVPAGQPTVKVTVNTWAPDLQQAWNAVPIPAGAVAAKGTDQSMAVWQPSSDKMWDFWLMNQTNGAWSARWGGEMDNVTTNPGYYTHAAQTNNWGGTATGMALLGGLVTIADLQRGYINHALALAVPLTEANAFSWPAQRTDGRSTAPTALPEGIRFRIDPNLDIASLHLPYLDRLLAQAAQTYGIVLRDTSGAVTFYGQDPTPTGSNPWASPFDGWSEGTYLSWLPWSHMQALQTQMSG